MNINEFVRERKGEWERLESISGKFRPGRAPKLSRDELWELGRLYTAAISDLALLKSSGLASDPRNDVIAYLNGLVIRVHGMIYRKRPLRWKSVREYLLSGFPGALRITIGYTILSAMVFFLFGAAGFVLGLDRPGFIELVVPERIIEKVEEGHVWFKGLHTVAPLASSWLMTHNVSVTFLVVAAGITFGVGTVYLLALNGLLIGTVAALCFQHNLSVEFWSFVLPHGSLELTAIFIAGGAGLILGHALIDPGPYRRGEYLAHRGRLVGRIALGCVPMLVMAGIIEAFFSPSPLPPWLKFAFASAVFAWFVTFVALGSNKAAGHGDGVAP